MKHPFTYLILSTLLITFIGCGGGSEVMGVDEADTEMNQAYKDARESLPEFIAALDDPNPTHQYLLKMRVQSGDVVEHMWATSVYYENKRFFGTLANAPHQIKDIKKGDRYQNLADDISDWAILDASGNEIAGGYTIRVMERKRAEAEDSATKP